MSKRSGSGASQERSPKKKRGLIAADQSRLDLYFSSPTNGHPGREGTDRHAVPYSFLAHALSELSSTRSRISILNILTNAIRVIIEYHSPSLLPAIYLLSNTLSPPYSPVELGLGPSVISKAIQHVSGLSSGALKRLYTSTGDVGDVAFQAKSKVRTLVPHPSLTASMVYSTLLQISKCAGQGAAAKKQGLVERLLVSAKGEEVRYLVRTLSQNLRVGAVRTSIFIALARAMVLVKPSNTLYSSEHCIDPTLLKRVDLDKKNKKANTVKDMVKEKFKAAEGLIRRVYAQHPSYDDIINALLERIPLHPTLGSPARSLSEVYTLLNGREFTAEYKYDGQRAQIHASKQVDDTVNVHIFSRHLEDMTTKYPDIIALVEVFFSTRPDLRSFIMDSEVVAINPHNGSLKTFQELSYRARKDVLIKDVGVQVGVFAFDLMFLDGEPDKRTTAWLKLKKDYVDGLGDSLDLIPIGAWHGNGRKAAWWSPILLGVWDAESGRAVAVCKCMSGFSDQFYKELTERYKIHEQSSVCSNRPTWACDMGGYRPHVYFKPQEVWEIRGADITISPTSVAALGLANPSRGLSLRFPRFIKVREDKGVMQASTPQFLADLWRKQDDRGLEGVDDGLIDVDLSDDIAESEEEPDDCNS
ncbi:hypothetical protein PLEOSDRAFT_1076810 [Pleurotus ostreatus PC15]|uniref:ATP-dependent DNA ligase family profile domain-containing protein n=1 Tax=Pleurotus ostreatus (strain PC15) TaxID=1137138 RepID=A0A067NUG1_PLEO1|nr:hypothetical protein PLEOSDRAFT_1076810 [Pleurotus ostreatus PC15]